MAITKTLILGLLAASAVAVFVWTAPATGLTQFKLFRDQLVERWAQDDAYVKLNSGHYIPLLGWGSSGATGEIATAAVQTAVFAGFRHIDAAEMYGNEEALGKGLQMIFKNSNVKRKDLFIVSKVGNDHHAADEVLQAARRSLANLQLDYLDLYHVHWPNSEVAGPTVQPPFNETWAAMEDLVDKGLVKSIGVSNFSPEKIEILMQGARIKPAVNQVEVHCNFRNQRVIEWCKKEGIHVTAYAPLSSPSTVSKMGKTLPNLLKDETVGSIAEKHGKTPAQVLLQWGLQHGTSVIPKSGNARHIKENQGVWGWSLPSVDFDTLSTFKFQKKYFDGGFVMNKDGPYRTYEDLWNEPEL